MSKLLTLVLVLSASLVGGCFEHPLPSTDFAKTPDFKPTTDPTGDPAVETESRQIVDRVVETAFGDGRRTEDEVLIDLLTAESGGVKPFRMDFKDIRYMQEKYLTLLKARAGATPPGPTTPPAPEKPLPVFRFDRTQCKAHADSVDILRGDIRYVKEIFRKNVDPCDYDFSLNFELMLNALLVNKEVRVDLNGERKLKSMPDFIRWLADNGFETRAEFRTYLASFFRLHKHEGDLEDAASEIPIPLWLDLDLKTPTGKPVLVPAAHSEVYFRFKHAQLGTLHVKIHFSTSGFDYEADAADPTHWTGMRVLESYGPERIPQLLLSSKRVADTYQLYLSRFPAPPPMGGFGLLGVCTDGAALMIRDAGSTVTLPFPMIRTDLVKMPEIFALKSLWDVLVPDSAVSELERPASERLTRLRDRLLASYPFTEETPSLFTDYNELIRELQKLGNP